MLGPSYLSWAGCGLVRPGVAETPRQVETGETGFTDIMSGAFYRDKDYYIEGTVYCKKGYIIHIVLQKIPV